MIQATMRFLSAAISIYMLLIFIRILLTWFQGPMVSRPVIMLSRITDPYLDWFRRFRVFRTGRFDFSPVVALITLGILSSITGSIAMHGRISLGIVLAIVTRAVWSAASFFLMFFLILVIIRYVGFLAGGSSVSPFWMALDHTLQPMVYRLSERLFRSQTVSYPRGLLVTGGLLFVAWLVGGFLIRQLIVFMATMPI